MNRYSLFILFFSLYIIPLPAQRENRLNITSSFGRMGVWAGAEEGLPQLRSAGDDRSITEGFRGEENIWLGGWQAGLEARYGQADKTIYSLGISAHESNTRYHSLGSYRPEGRNAIRDIPSAANYRSAALRLGAAVGVFTSVPWLDVQFCGQLEGAWARLSYPAAAIVDLTQPGRARVTEVLTSEQRGFTLGVGPALRLAVRPVRFMGFAIDGGAGFRFRRNGAGGPNALYYSLRGGVFVEFGV